MHKVCLLFLLFGCQLMFAQQQKTLIQIIEDLSEAYDITFSYKPSEINKFLKINNEKFLNLEKAIKSIKIQTGLTLEKVDEHNYVIIKPIKKYQNLIYGKVVDKNSIPIPDVFISNGNQHITTNTKGDFYLNISNKNNFTDLTSTGYETKSIPFSSFKDSCNTIVLQEELIQLDKIVIENYMTSGLSKNENGSITVKMRKAGVLPGIIEPDAIQTLQFIPGLQSPDETVTGLHIRGSTPDQNLILYDGVKMYQDAHFFGLLSAFNPYVINNIQLYRSATKAKYGGHAGGVIHLGVDSNIPKKIMAGISATLTHANIDIKIPIFKDRLAIFASARRGITDFAKTITYKKYAEVAFQNTNILNSLNESEENIFTADNQFLYKDYYSKIIFTPYNFLQFDFGFVKNQNELSFNGVNPFFKSDVNDDLKVKSETLYESISFKNSVLGSHSLQLSTTSLNKKYRGLNEFDIASHPPTLLEITFNKENYLKETSIQYHGEKQIFKNGLVQFGYQRNRSEVGYRADSYGLDLRTFRESFSGKEISQSFFSDLKFRNNKLQLNIGGRRQYFNRLHDFFWEPRVFLNYKLLTNLSLRASYEIKHQSISQITDLRNDGLGKLFNRLWVVSTEESIPVIKNNQTAIGFDFQKRGWTIDFEMYSKKLEGIGILLTDNIFSPRNVSGTNRIKGIDILLKKKWKYYETWLSYSFSESKHKFEEINNNKPFRGSFDIPHSLIWSHTLTFNKFSFSMGYRHRKGIPYTQKTLDLNNPQSNFIVFETYNGKRLPDYHRLDLTANYNFYSGKEKKIKVRIGFTLQNLTNQSNILSRDFRAIESNILEDNTQITRPELRKIDRISLGLTPNFIIRCSI